MTAKEGGNLKRWVAVTLKIGVRAVEIGFRTIDGSPEYMAAMSGPPNRMALQYFFGFAPFSREYRRPCSVC